MNVVAMERLKLALKAVMVMAANDPEIVERGLFTINVKEVISNVGIPIKPMDWADRCNILAAAVQELITERDMLAQHDFWIVAPNSLTGESLIFVRMPKVTIQIDVYQEHGFWNAIPQYDTANYDFLSQQDLL